MNFHKKQREEYLIIDGEWKPVMSPIEKNLRRILAFLPLIGAGLMLFTTLPANAVIAFLLIAMNALCFAVHFTTGKIKFSQAIRMTLFVLPFSCIILFKPTALLVAVAFVIALAFTLVYRKELFK